MKIQVNAFQSDCDMNPFWTQKNLFRIPVEFVTILSTLAGCKTSNLNEKSLTFRQDYLKLENQSFFIRRQIKRSSQNMFKIEIK